MKRPEGRATLAVAAAAAAIVGILVLFRAASAEAVYPVERVKRILSDGVFSRIRGVFRGAAAQAENERLRRELAALAMERGYCERLREECIRLRRLLGYSKALPGKWKAAAVLSAGGGAAGARKTIRISRGALSGLRQGAVVAVPDGLVGRVASVSPHTAEVLLITDPSLRVACMVEGARGAKGILSGGTDEMLVLRYLTVGAELPPRSRILTSGLGGVFPGGLAVGTLIGMRESEDGAIREGDVEPAVDFATLEDVFVQEILEEQETPEER